MTIAITVKVTDGIVLAADSATTIGNETSGNVYNNAEKVFNLLKGARVAIVVWGQGSVGAASIAGLLKDLREKLTNGDKKWKVDPKAYTVEDVAKKVQQFIYSDTYRPWLESLKVPKEKWPYMGMMIAGYASDAIAPDVWRLDVNLGEAVLKRTSGPDRASDLLWGGDAQAVQRLVLGYDYRLPSELAEDLKLGDEPGEKGLTKKEITEAIRRVSAKIEPDVVPPWMPIQDAIDLAEFLVTTAAKYSRYTPGYQTIGGPTDIATITKYEGFRWVKRKHFYDAALNPKA